MVVTNYFRLVSRTDRFPIRLCGTNARVAVIRAATPASSFGIGVRGSMIRRASNCAS